MRVLIVEDTESKREALKDFVTLYFSGSVVVEALSFQDGGEKIETGPYDFVLLDMTMPTFSITAEDRGGRKRPFAGRDLISRMHRRGYIYPVIVVTRFDLFPDAHRNISLQELDDELKSEYPDVYKGYVFFDPSKTSWPIKLKQLVELVLKRNK